MTHAFNFCFRALAAASLTVPTVALRVLELAADKRIC